MNFRINYLSVLVYIGLICCFVSLMNSTYQYFEFSKKEIVIKALKSDRDIMISKISKLPIDKSNMNIILNELRHRNEKNTTLYGSLVRMTSDIKSYTRNEQILWLSVTVIFILLSIMTKKGKKQEE